MLPIGSKVRICLDDKKSPQYMNENHIVDKMYCYNNQVTTVYSKTVIGDRLAYYLDCCDFYWFENLLKVEPHTNDEIIACVMQDN